MRRRDFIVSSAMASAVGVWKQNLGDLTKRIILSSSEVDWNEVRKQFPITSWEKLQFNSGSSGVLPIPVEDHLINLTRQMSRMAPYQVWGTWQESLNSIKSRLGQLTGSSPENLSLIRNTTEGLNICTSHIKLEIGDEVISASFDYPYAVNDWQTKMREDGIVLVEPEVVLPASDEEVIEAYRSAISPQTKVMHITHMTHREGHIIPVKELVTLAKEHDIITVVDGAHVVGQIPLDLSDLDPDCYVSSLHKWLNAPHGNGLLYVHPRILNKMRHFPSAPAKDADDNYQFAHLGTRAFHIEIGLEASLDFHDMIGSKAKYDRLQYLKDYWTSQLQDDARFIWHTDLSDAKSCSVVTIGIKGKGGGAIRKELDQEYDIHAKSVGVKGGGVRISPNIFTSEEDLDTLVAALQEIAVI